MFERLLEKLARELEARSIAYMVLAVDRRFQENAHENTTIPGGRHVRYVPCSP